MDAGPLPLCALPVSSLYVCKVSCSLFPFKDLILLFVSEQHTRLDFDLSEAFLKDIPTAVHRHVLWLRLHRSSTSLSHHYFSLFGTQRVLAHRLAFLPVSFRSCQSRSVQHRLDTGGTEVNKSENNHSFFS